jgi:cytochrome c oxidase assembly protein subunit 15
VRPLPAASAEPEGTVPWLAATLISIVVMIVLGGVVRLAHAGLSIVEWQPLSGILPPLSQEAWQQAFDAYRDTPEYALVNAGMSLDAFRSIYWLEYVHRLAARAAGLLFVVPAGLWLLRGRFRPSMRVALVGIGALYAAQAVMGWLMVASGLVDQPWVSPYRLAVHLLLALGLLAWVLWLLLDRTLTEARSEAAGRVRGPALALLVAVVVQMGGGALMAGHRAGLVADTFPLIHGRWLPATAFGSLADGVSNPVTVHFEHRWFAFIVLGAALWVHARARRVVPLSTLCQLALAAAVLSGGQVALGIAVVLSGVPPWQASLHQGVGVLLFAAVVAVVHLAREPNPYSLGRPRPAPGVPST